MSRFLYSRERLDGLQIYYIDSEDRQLNVDGLAETPGVDDLDDNVLIFLIEHLWFLVDLLTATYVRTKKVEHLHLHLYKIYSIDVNPTAKSIAYRIFRDFDQTEVCSAGYNTNRPDDCYSIILR